MIDECVMQKKAMDDHTNMKCGFLFGLATAFSIFVEFVETCLDKKNPR